jgi:hypothetical protein
MDLVESTVVTTAGYVWVITGSHSAPIPMAARSKAWMSVFILCLCSVAALRRTDPPSKESYRLS